jgi:hypothetical protein
MNSIHSYDSILNKYSVNDVEILAPSLKKIQDIIYEKYASLKGSERYKKQDLKEFLIIQVYTPDSPLKQALLDFIEASDSRNRYSNRNNPKNRRVFPAIVALNDLYYSIKRDENVENVLYSMYFNGYFSDILSYVKDLHNNAFGNNMTNASSQRTVSLGSLENASSLFSDSGISVLRNTNANANFSNNGAFGPLNGGGKKTRKTKKRKCRSRKHIKAPR